MWSDILAAIDSAKNADIDVTPALKPNPSPYVMTARVLVYNGQTNFASYKMVVVVDRTHPLFPWDDVRNNPGFPWHLDISEDFKKRSTGLSSLIVQDDPSDPNDMRLWIAASTFKMGDVESMMVELWEFCCQPKRNKFKLATVSKLSSGFGYAYNVHTMPMVRDTEYYNRVADRIVFGANKCIFCVPDLEDSYHPNLIANILTQKHAGCCNGHMFTRMTPELWEAVKACKFVLVDVKPDMDTHFGRYTKAVCTRIMP